MIHTTRSVRPANPAWRGSLYYLLFWASMAVCMPYLNVHYSRLGLSGFEIGLLGSVMPLMRITAAPALSALADRRGWKKRILSVSLLAAGVFMFLLGRPQTFILILPIVTLLAMAHSAVTPIADALVARMAKRYQMDYGKLRLWGSLGFAITALVTGALWQNLGFDTMFLVGALAIVPVVLAAQGLEEITTTQTQVRPPVTYLLRDHGLMVLFIANFLIGAGEGLYITFSGVYMDVLGGAEWMIGGIFGLSALVELPTMQYAGALTRRIGKPLTLIIAYGFMGLAFFGYAISRTPEILLLWAMVKGIGFGLYFPTTVSLADERAPEAWSSTVQSLLMALGWGLAPLLTIPLAGWISDTLGLTQVFSAAGSVQLMAMLVLGWAMLRRKFAATPLLG